MKKKILSIAVAMGLSLGAWAESADYINPIITSMPSTSIAPDARAAGMGDLGVATDGDMNSQYWNAAKYAMMDKVRGGITANYTPWLRSLVGDIDLAYIAGFYNISERAGAVSASLTYFSMGDVSITNIDETVLGQARPNEFALDLAYSRKLHEYVSMGVGLRFLYSDLTNGYNNSTGGNTGEMTPGWTMAADVNLYYHQPIDIAMGTSYFNLGFALKNMGGKVSYNDGAVKNFIPTTASLGVGYELPFDNYNKLTFNLQAEKLMVPSMKSKYAVDENGEELKAEPLRDWYSNLNPVKGFFQSLHDAPYGAKEEFKEVRWAAGLEYTYNRQFFARAGFGYEDKMKGNRTYVTFGAGFHLSIVMLDVSYCVGVASTNPLNNTMRFTLGFDLAGIQDLVNNRK